MTITSPRDQNKPPTASSHVFKEMDIKFRFEFYQNVTWPEYMDVSYSSLFLVPNLPSYIESIRMFVEVSCPEIDAQWKREIKYEPVRNDDDNFEMKDWDPKL